MKASSLTLFMSFLTCFPRVSVTRDILFTQDYEEATHIRLLKQWILKIMINYELRMRRQPKIFTKQTTHIMLTYKCIAKAFSIFFMFLMHLSMFFYNMLTLGSYFTSGKHNSSLQTITVFLTATEVSK